LTSGNRRVGPGVPRPRSSFGERCRREQPGELLRRNPAKDRAPRKTVGRTAVESINPSDLPSCCPDIRADVQTLEKLTTAVVQAGGRQCWGDVVTLLATTALRISEASGLVTSDVDLDQNILHVKRQTYPGRGGLVTKTTKGRRRRVVPVIKPLRPTLERLSKGKAPDTRLIVGHRGGVITTANPARCHQFAALVQAGSAFAAWWGQKWGQ
jgi:integrase-like protein